MTREDAMKRCDVSPESSRPKWLVDALESLGMLKLDEPEPKNIVEHLIGHCRLRSPHGGDCEPMNREEAKRIVDMVNSAGLKIVEK